MRRLPVNIIKSLDRRNASGSIRVLKFSKDIVDFSSNDYLGFARNQEIFSRAGQIIEKHSQIKNGSGGSRLLTGNHPLYQVAEDTVAQFHKAETALIFNSGYDANLGFFSVVPGRGDLILYDEFIHASIRDGINLSKAKAYKFQHNNLEDLAKKVEAFEAGIPGEIFVVTESIFSMDGDSPNLSALAQFTTAHECHLVIDEAHAIGVHGPGITVGEGLDEEVFARIVTFGKAMGSHGAAILGSAELKSFLVNYARSLIYSTALPPHSVATIIAAYEYFENDGAAEVEKLNRNIECFKNEVSGLGLQEHLLKSDSAIQACILPGNNRVREVSAKLSDSGFDVRPILSPTVAGGKERLRICLHSYNSVDQIKELLTLLKEEI